ncbi:hypothetical protein [Moorena producens]|uniref:hypothetical protein n=1 Tax=Moorena producens TaxID=1155739 RepID=UPI003C72D7A1
MLKTLTTTSTIITVSTILNLLGVDSVQAVPITYYDIDFSAPTHTLGSAPTEGFSSDTISSVVFGNPVVESSFGPLTSESLVFNTKGNTTPCCFYDQIKLDLGGGSDRYQVSFDLSTRNYVNTGSANTFTLLFDTPQVRTIHFMSNGTIRYFYPFQGSGTIGSFSDNTLLNMMVDINLAASTWDIFMNDSLLYSGLFSPSGDDINSLRFSFGGVSTTSFDSIGLDNIRVTNGEVVETVPEPSSCNFLSLLTLGAIAKTIALKKRKIA